MQPPPTQRRRKSRRNSTRSLRNAPGPLTRQLSAGSANTGVTTPAQTTPRQHRRQASEGSGSDMDTASLASGDSGNCLFLLARCVFFGLYLFCLCCLCRTCTFLLTRLSPITTLSKTDSSGQTALQTAFGVEQFELRSVFDDACDFAL